MPIYLCGHHDGEVATFQLLGIAEFEPEHALILGDDVHGHISANRHHHFQDISEWHRTGVVYLLCIFAFAILNESDSIVADDESSEDRVAVVASASIAALASHIIADIYLLRRLETILIQVILTFEGLIHVFRSCIL